MLTIGSRAQALKGTATGKQGTIVGYVVRIDGEDRSRSYVAASVKEITPYVPIRVTVGQPLVAEVVTDG